MPVTGVEPRMIISTDKGYAVPSDKWETALWLANYFIKRDLEGYKNISHEEQKKQICKNHRMKYSADSFISELGWRLAKKLYNEKKKDQLYAIFYGISDGRRPRKKIDITEIGPVNQEPEIEESGQISLFPKNESGF